MVAIAEPPVIASSWSYVERVVSNVVFVKSYALPYSLVNASSIKAPHELRWKVGSSITRENAAFTPIFLRHLFPFSLDYASRGYNDERMLWSDH